MERFSYGTLGEEQTQAVLDAYQRTTSLLQLSMQEGIFVSAATAGRVIQAAVEHGVLDASQKRGLGRSNDVRLRAAEVIEKHPDLSRREQAQLAGCSEATLYRAISEQELSHGISGEIVIGEE